MLKPQDIVVIIRLLIAEERGERLSYAKLASELSLSTSEAHGAVKRAAASRLLVKDQETATIGWRPHHVRIQEFLCHGLPYVFPAIYGGIETGLPTAHAAPRWKSSFLATNSGELPIWPCQLGKVQGRALIPLYKSVPIAAVRDPALYEWLALLDMLRGAYNRAKLLALEQLGQRLLV
jgi:hypothetical protein